MPNRHSVKFLQILFLLILALALVGCSDDEETTTDPSDPGFAGAEGDIFVETAPIQLDVAWTLSLPGGETISETNNFRVRDQDPGVFTLSWPMLEGWNGPRPSTQSQTMEGGSNLIFSAIYLPLPGTAMINVLPEGLDAPWHLTGPADFDLTSSGDATLTDLVPGLYEMEWLGVLSFDSPGEATSSLGPLSPMFMTGIYSFPDSLIYVNPIPVDSEAPWTMTGPEDFSASDNGQTWVDIEESGDYHITWGDVAGMITPDPGSLYVDMDDPEDFYFTGEYRTLDGTVNLDAVIGSTNYPWSLTGPTGTVQSGEGIAQLTGMRTGTYTVDWLGLDGWLPGAPETLELSPEGSIAFSVAAEAAVSVRPLPADLNATWQLTGPGGYSLPGEGEMLVSGLSAGSYTLTWDDVSGWTTPAAGSQTLANDNGLVFESEYARNNLTLHVNTQPVGLDISWDIVGPEGYSESGVGMATLPLTESGAYTVSWGDVVGYMLPGPETAVFNGENNLEFRANYVELLELVQLAPGSFDLGSPGTEFCRSGQERLHGVEITHDFVIQATEVTNAEYIALAQWAFDRGYITADQYGVNDNLDGSTVELLDLDDGDQEIFFENGVFSSIRLHHPVKEVSWFGAVAYCDWLSMYRGLDRAYDHESWQCGTTHPSLAPGFRLPTEAEWEFACRAGTTTPYSNGSIGMAHGECFSDDLDEFAWYQVNGNAWSNEVGMLDPNPWGLYDMHGNVGEWCNDWYDNSYYYSEFFDEVPNDDPPGPLSGELRMVRGGYFFSPAEDCRSAARKGANPSNAAYDIGFRVVLSGN